MGLLDLILALRCFRTLAHFKRPHCQPLNCTKRKLIVVLDHVSAELIDVSVLIHLINDGIVPFGAEMLVEEHAVYQSLLPVLDLYEFELHPLHECEFLLVVGPEQPLELLRGLSFCHLIFILNIQ